MHTRREHISHPLDRAPAVSHCCVLTVEPGRPSCHRQRYRYRRRQRLTEIRAGISRDASCRQSRDIIRNAPFASRLTCRRHRETRHIHTRARVCARTTDISTAYTKQVSPPVNIVPCVTKEEKWHLVTGKKRAKSKRVVIEQKAPARPENFQTVVRRVRLCNGGGKVDACVGWIGRKNGSEERKRRERSINRLGEIYSRSRR